MQTRNNKIKKHLNFNVKINDAQTIRKHFLNGKASSFIKSYLDSWKDHFLKKKKIIVFQNPEQCMKAYSKPKSMRSREKGS